MPDIKLVAVDIGGTLINDDNIIPKQNIETFKLLKEKNIEISLITARMFSSTKYISNRIQADYGIFGNGNNIISLKNKNVIFSSNIPKEEVKKIIDFSKENHLYTHISETYYEGSDELKYFLLKHKILNLNYTEELKSNIIHFDNIYSYVDKNNDIVNVILVSEKNLDEIYKKVKIKFPELSINEYNKNSEEKTIGKTINYIEIGNKPSTKATGLKKLIKELGIQKEEVLVIGDGNNDIEMFEEFPNSGCLANGSALAKEKANYISNYTNNEAGVSDIIKYYIKKR